MADVKNENYAEFEHTFVDKFSGGKEINVKIRFRRPSSASVSRAQSKMLKNPTAAFTALCKDCVHPDDRDLFASRLEAYTGLATTFGSALLSASGFGDLGN